MVWKEQTGGNYWEPVEGETVEGKIEAIQEGEYGRQYIISNGKGATITTPAHKVLQSRMSKAQVGDRVKIEVLGQELPKVKGHKPTQLYRVYIDE